VCIAGDGEAVDVLADDERRAERRQAGCAAVDLDAVDLDDPHVRLPRATQEHAYRRLPGGTFTTAP
jgi:hypothetical protein